jgi:hypothetical protein
VRSSHGRPGAADVFSAWSARRAARVRSVLAMNETTDTPRTRPVTLPSTSSTSLAAPVIARSDWLSSRTVTRLSLIALAPLARPAPSLASSSLRSRQLRRAGQLIAPAVGRVRDTPPAARGCGRTGIRSGVEHPLKVIDLVAASRATARSNRVTTVRRWFGVLHVEGERARHRAADVEERQAALVLLIPARSIGPRPAD